MLSGAYRRGPISSMQCQSRMLEMRGSAPVLVLHQVCIPFGDARKGVDWDGGIDETRTVWVDAQRPPCVRPDDQISISMSKRESQEEIFRDAFNGGPCPTSSTRQCPQRNQRCEVCKLVNRVYGNGEVQENDGRSRQRRFCQTI